MKHKLLLIISSFVATIATVLALSGGHAFAATVTWTGTAGDNKFSTGGNWQGGVAPTNGDTLVFPGDKGQSSVGIIDNDIDNLSVAGITFSGDTSNANCNSVRYYTFNNAGSSTSDPLTISGSIDGTGLTGTCNLIVTFMTDVALSGATVAVDAGSKISTVAFQNALSLGATNLTLVNNIAIATGYNLYGTVTGSGSITANGNGYVHFTNGDKSGFTGSLIANNGVLSIDGPLQASSIAVNANASLNIQTSAQTNRTITTPINLTGAGSSLYQAQDNTKVLFEGGSADWTDPKNPVYSKEQLTLSSVTLGSDVLISTNGTYQDILTITSLTANGHIITIGSGSAGTITANGNTYDIPYYDDSDNGQATSYNVGGYGWSGMNKFIIDGTNTGTAYLNKNNVLMGTGTVGEVYADGHVAPGHSPGCMNTGNLNFLANGVYDAELGGTTACSGYDQLKVTGTVDINTTATLNTTLYNNFQPATGNTFTIIDNDGSDAVTGTFNNLPEGATFNVGNAVFRITYKGGDGNDVVLTVVAVTAGANSLQKPNTGYKLLTGHPIITLVATSSLAAGIYVLARKDKLAFLRRK